MPVLVSPGALRERTGRPARGPGADVEAAKVARPEPHRWFPETGAYPVRDGNRVRALVDGETAFRRIREVVEAARFRVWVTVAAESAVQTRSLAV